MKTKFQKALNGMFPTRSIAGIMGKGVLIFAFFFVPQVSFGAVVYDHSNTNGSTILMSNNTGNTLPTLYAPNTTTTGTITLSTDLNSFVTLSGNVSYLRVKRVSGEACTTLTGSTISVFMAPWTSPYVYSASGAGVASGSYCDIPISIPSGTSIGAISLYPATVDTSITLDASNGGAHYNANNGYIGLTGFAFQLCDSGGCSGGFAPSNTSTRITAVVPANGAVVSTSTPITYGADIYMNATDYQSGAFLRYNVSNQNSVVGSMTPSGGSFLGTPLYTNVNISEPVCSWWQVGALCDQSIAISSLNFEVPITATGTVSVTATTSAITLGGRTDVASEIVVPYTCYVLFTCENIFSATSTYFIVGTSTAFDLQYASDPVTATQNVLASSTAAIISASTSSDCAYASFNLGGCLSSLFIPTPEMMANVWVTLKDGIFSSFPFGYATRFVDIATGTDTGTANLPSISYTFGTSSAVPLQGLTYTFDLFTDQNMNKLATIYDDHGDNKNLWDIVDPYFYLIVWTAVLLVILEDMVTIEVGTHGVSFDRRHRGEVRLTRREKKKIDASYKDWNKSEIL